MKVKNSQKGQPIIDQVIKYVYRQGYRNEIIVPINQVKLYKRMILPYELVRFKGGMNTKEARECE